MNETPAALRQDAVARPFRLGYRPEIEGLRAVAILLVVLAHAKVPGLEGGFVGVDVFFVLSGYLITSLLLDELNGSGDLNIASFYARRLRRLLPALLLVLLCGSALAALLLAPFEQVQQSLPVAAAAIWLSNLLFSQAKLDYFGADADSSLFLHTWSLGVEEQFYLAWPALIMFLLGAWHWQGGGFNLQRLRKGLIVTAGITLLLSVFLTYTQPASAFYLAPSRAWQFAVGALVLLGTQRGTLASIRLLNVIGGWIGLLMILGSAVLLNAETAYPGYAALAPTLGTALILLFARPTDPHAVTRLLATGPMQAIGRVSYAWYLWHWPVLLLGATLVGASLAANLGLALLALILAVITYYLIETPIRRTRSRLGRPAFVFLISITLMTAAVCAALSWNSAARGWAESAAHERFSAVRMDVPKLYAFHCDDWYHSASVNICQFGNEKAEKRLLIIGDSIGLQWFPAITQLYERKGWQVLVLTKSSCPMVDQAYFYSRIGREYVECTQWRNQALEVARALHPDAVILGSSYDYPFSREEWVAGTRRVLDYIGPATQQIYILQSTPPLGINGPDCLSRRYWRSDLELGLPLPACTREVRNNRLNTAHAAVIEAAAPYATVQVIDMNAHICPDGVCAAERDGVIVYRDRVHVTATYITQLTDELERALEIKRSEH